MKRFFSKLLLALIASAAMPFVISFKSDAAVPINSATFPDANFRAVILSSYDQNGNGILDDYEIATTRSKPRTLRSHIEASRDRGAGVTLRKRIHG